MTSTLYVVARKKGTNMPARRTKVSLVLSAENELGVGLTECRGEESQVREVTEAREVNELPWTSRTQRFAD